MLLPKGIGKCGLPRRQSNYLRFEMSRQELSKNVGFIKVNRQQPRSSRLRPIQKIPTPIKLLISPLPDMINQICKKYSLENFQDKKTRDDTCDIFQK